MKFVDTATVDVRAGNGGNGAVSFRRERFVERGGPDGGDGGRGGNVIFQATRNLNTLQTFRHKQKLHAEDGQPGARARRHGKNGQDLIVQVPMGTVVSTAEGFSADLAEHDQTVVVAHGGAGGFGNAHFVSATRQAPRVAEKGEPGDHFEATLELKLVADVGLVGLPNAGKSTFLSVVSNARPEIADYPFTTITPNLGVADIDANSMLIADIPGLIEGASQGKGLGDAFLRHIERTRVIIHLIDAYHPEPAQAYQTIMKELADYTIDLSGRPQIIGLTKTEGLDQELIDLILGDLQPVVGSTQIVPISSQSGYQVKQLLHETWQLLESARAEATAVAEEETNTVPVYGFSDQAPAWRVRKSGKSYVVSGKKIERFAHRTHFETEAGQRRLRDIMSKMGITHELKRQGAQSGSTIRFKGVTGKLEL
jgi:GTP-binding protein